MDPFRASHVELGRPFSHLDVESDGSFQSNGMSVCAGLLDGTDLSSEGGPHRGGEGTAGEQCQPGTSRHGEVIQRDRELFIRL